ncbi:hypothetical protein C2S52_018932 [Perilla frutescens var. hirtella]|nr:hypothetical protein C2S52_018932 [Perilla frutescens var. hirtella]
MEILELLTSYGWEAKIAIVLASFVVDFARFIHVGKLYTLKPIPDDIFDDIKSNFKKIIEESIKLTRSIAKFGKPSKYISNEAKPMALALDQIPIAVHLMTRSVISCASLLAEIHGESEISSSIETSEISILGNEIATMHCSLEEKHQRCQDYIDNKKMMKYVEKLKLWFNQRTVYKDNEKILKLIIKASGLSNKDVRVGDLKGKTVLLFISDLDISHEYSKLTQIYQESRENPEPRQFEILWLPIVENEEDDLKQTFLNLRSKMQWRSLQYMIPIKSAMVKFMMEEWQWNYSEKNPILVALDPRGKMVNPNAFQMMWAWGNEAYPFTKRCELDIWNHKKWSLQLLVEDIDQKISDWIKENKVIFLFGGNRELDDSKWIKEFVEAARKVAEDEAIQLEMMYISENTSPEVVETLENCSDWLKTEDAKYFLNRIKGIVKSESCKRGKIATAKKAILDEMQHVYRLHRSGKSWALISQGAGSGPGNIAKGSGNVILRELLEFDSWSSQVRNKGFVVALNDRLAGGRLTPESDICKLCHRAM